MTPHAGKAGFFITGTDTAVGKTLVAVGLTRAFVARGLRTAVMKPVAAGVTLTADGARNDDALELLGASNVAAAYEDVNPWLLTTPASPHLAARHDGVTIGHEKIRRAYERLASGADVIVVEGAGGWHAPISATETMADVVEKLTLSAVPLSAILVVGLRLGCLNHALLTREAIRARGIPFAGWIANELHAQMPLVEANIETLTTRFGAAPLAVVPAAFEARPAELPPWASTAAKSLVSP